MRRIAALSARLAVTATLGLTGCCYYELRDSLDECCYNVRVDYLARRAWHRCSGNFDKHPHKKYFGRGFRDGYESVALGGDGCCPTVPPRHCWSWCYDACEGQERMNAWFDGWAAGAIAAEADGLAGGQRIAVRPPACPSCYTTPTPAMHGGMMVPPSPMHGPVGTPIGMPVEMAPPDGYSIPSGPTVLPPPAPPSVSPTVPADEAYESYDDKGVYFQ